VRYSHKEKITQSLNRRKNARPQASCLRPQFLLSVSLILGAALPEPEGVDVPVVSAPGSSIANTGGLVARGDETATGKPKLDTEGPRANPRLIFWIGSVGVAEPGGGAGLEADAGPEGVLAGIVLELNSAQRGHLRFVSG
jgi:hypothetical protein